MQAPPAATDSPTPLVASSILELSHGSKSAVVRPLHVASTNGVLGSVAPSSDDGRQKRNCVRPSLLEFEEKISIDVRQGERLIQVPLATAPCENGGSRGHSDATRTLDEPRHSPTLSESRHYREASYGEDSHDGSGSDRSDSDSASSDGDHSDTDGSDADCSDSEGSDSDGSDSEGSDSDSTEGLDEKSGSSSSESSYEGSSSDYSSSYTSSYCSSAMTSSLSSFEISLSMRRAAQGLPNEIKPSVQRQGDDSISSNEDDFAQIMARSMQNHGEVIGRVLAERASCIDSIKWLGHHLPESVVAFLIDEIEVEETGHDRAFSQHSDNSFSSQVEYGEREPGGDSHGNAVYHGTIDVASDQQVVWNDEGGHNNSTWDASSDHYKDDAETDSVDNSGFMKGPLHLESERLAMATEGNDQSEQLLIPHEAHCRHSSIEHVSENHVTENSLLVEDDIGKKRATRRRMSMPLVLRQMETSVSSLQHQGSFTSESQCSISSSCHPRLAKEASMIVSTGRDSITVGSTSSLLLQRQALGIDTYGHSFKPSDDGGEPYFDPFPFDSDDEERKQERLRQHRVMKTRDSIRKLAITNSQGDQDDYVVPQEDDPEGSTGEDQDFYFTDAIPPATRHDCALLFVDISGFTKLSTTLDVEPFSKTTNSYFQMIVDEVEAFGGDVLKFAGDALFAEWQATTSNPLESGDGMSWAGSSQGSIEPWHGLGLEECVLTAAACGAKIVDKCSDFPVHSGKGATGPVVATLNVHCGLGFGEVVGVHVGDKQSRMEYLILGDPIEQVAKAILVASRGEVVASPEALIILEETADLDECLLAGDVDTPQVIATKSTCFFHPKGTVHVQQNWTVTLQDCTTKPRERLAKRCDDWNLPALTRLRQRMSLYVHPVVVEDEFAVKVYPGDRNRAQERHRSEAELRDVYTVFIMPLITARLTGDDEEDCKVLVLLNDIMLIMTRELARFKGQLRQFIVDDKGVVLIANFGLRGSTFPNMVAERAIPFTTTVQTLLKAELNTECQMGATYGKAYCGVVGGVSRHEYAVLGPSVNLAARLMANPNNTGFLVDEAVQQKAGGRQFRALPPVKAKGYPDPVPIFEPLHSRERSWKDLDGRFVGRVTERFQLVSVAEDIIEYGGPSKLVFVTAESGAGKSALCLQTTKQIHDMCTLKGVLHLISMNVCSEGDAFVPFSIARPMFLDILNYSIDGDGKRHGIAKEVVDSDQIQALLNGEARESDVAQSLVHLVQICRHAKVPSRYIETISRLILTRNRADVVEGPRRASNTIELNDIARFLVSTFLSCTLQFDLVVLALDDVTNMDEMSWKVIELLYKHAQNLMILGTSRPVTRDEIHIDGDFWDALHDEGIASGNFTEMHLSPMQQSEIDLLVANSLGRNEHEIDPQISRDLFVQSGGMPNLASEILDNFYKNDLDGPFEWKLHARDDPDRGLDVGNVGELVLHRMDALPSNVRTHLNLGAILGSAFELMDVVTAFEQYRGVKKEERLEHAKSVHESLQEAVRQGILEVENKETGFDMHTRFKSFDHPYSTFNTTYKFTHDVWRSNILRLTLDEWKRDMHSLIAQSMETIMDSQLASDYRVLTKMFCHWKESGSAKKAATLALKMGRSLEDIGLTHQSLIVYREALDMWKSMANNDLPDESIGGLSMQLLEKLQASDLEHLIKLNVALGRCFTNILDPKESIKSFQTALNFIHRAPSSLDLEDRSIIFPVFSGLFVALRFGHNEDLKYEQGLVRMFLRETKLYEDPVHYSRALAMQAEMFGRHGQFDLALEAASQLRGLYDVDKHSASVMEAYGSDRSAQCIAQSASWNMRLDRTEVAIETCEYVLQNLMPKMDPQNVHNSFLILYPIIWVMKDNGMALRARDAFEKYVVKRFATLLDERGLTSDRPLHTPVTTLLDIIGTSCATDSIEQYTEWALVEKNGRFCSELNFTTGSIGRTADSITAEICLLLAQSCTSRERKTLLVRKGFELARDAMDLTSDKEGESRGMISAHLELKPIFEELEGMHLLLPPERRTRRLSCRW